MSAKQSARRNILRTALATIGLGYTAKSLAATPAQTSGPFYPVTEQKDKGLS